MCVEERPGKDKGAALGSARRKGDGSSNGTAGARDSRLKTEGRVKRAASGAEGGGDGWFVMVVVVVVVVGDGSGVVVGRGCWLGEVWTG